MTGMFPELEPPAPDAVATTAPLFDVEPGNASVHRVASSAAPGRDHRPTGDVALFATALMLPSETATGPLAFHFTVD
jgi:hypothetical protein